MTTRGTFLEGTILEFKESSMSEPKNLNENLAFILMLIGLLLFFALVTIAIVTPVEDYSIFLHIGEK
ncbi:MAG: hypothetical protein HY602_03110 [Parcubacteria group bacterium]|nr:hypothetical protein [Parcubacteria group bacterium]